MHPVRTAKYWKRHLMILISLTTFILAGLVLLNRVRHGRWACASITLSQLTFDIGWYQSHEDFPPVAQPSWAQYSPYFPIEEYTVPDHCRITQANILERHGARYPTLGAAAGIAAAVFKLQATQFKDPRLAFILDYVYDLGVDDLLPFGALQSFMSGELHFHRYQNLVSHDNVPFVRSDSSERVILSAKNWTAGFSTASAHVYNPILSVVMEHSGNDTLDDTMCPAAGDASMQKYIWLSTFAPAISKRFSDMAIDPAALTLDLDDIPSLISLCPFDTVAKEKLSPWCGIFAEDEFDSFEYFGSLDKYYGTGHGQDLGPVQGVGYINELLARLTGTPVNDSTQTNRTLDSSPDTFPLNRTIYADFSHDNQMIAIYSGMGLFDVPPLDPGSKAGSREWAARKMVPFSARMVVEKMNCVDIGNDRLDALSDFVRVLVNDRVMPLEFCDGVDGLCRLDKFIASQSYARNNGNGDFERCYE